MPTDKSFGSYRIMLFAEDHNPPHVHVIGPDFQAKVGLQTPPCLPGPFRRAIAVRRWPGSRRTATG